MGNTGRQIDQCKCEAVIRDALKREGFKFTEETDPANAGLDFYLSNYDLAIEVKAMHSPRIAEQMSRHKNVIAVQGIGAAEFVAAMLVDFKL